MAHVTFTANIQRHVKCSPADVAGKTIGEVLGGVFADNAAARGYVLDDQGGLRRHMIVFVNGTAIIDRVALSDPVPDAAEVYITQALSGG